jgi:hypothetical protein
MQEMSRRELLDLPATIDLPTCGRALGVSEPVIRERWRRGELDQMGIRVLRVGQKLRVITADVLNLLGIEEDQ